MNETAPIDALDAFLEIDIARYLENRLAPPEDKGRPDLATPVVFLTRDYERELNEALDHDEINRAKHILHDLKERFDEAPDGTAEKNQIKTLLIGLYERFRMRLEHDDDQDRREHEDVDQHGEELHRAPAEAPGGGVHAHPPSPLNTRDSPMYRL